MASPLKLLVANRSEIACRIFQACRELGIRTVGIYAPGDEEARHLTFADEIYPVKSYLDPQDIVSQAKLAQVSLIHPGYGFLSERPIFADAVEKAGINFLGPTAQTMEMMGGKIAAKEIAIKNKVPTLPWAKIPEGGDLKKAAKTVGFPLLLKASAGGGGKGMRIVRSESELNQAAESASSEAKAAFGDGTLFMEKLVEKPRHIEVQVFGDGRGGAVHLHERDCSLQRKHQKVWEEATAPHLSESTRKGLFESAVNLACATQYRSAGTVEFLVDEGGKYYFLEMNTRLQVEHPVTELVTGVDLVIAQIEQALHPKKSILTSSPEPRGHAIETRLYAEDPSQGFMPTPGTISQLIWPTGPGIRIDSGIEQGQAVGTSFDSMLGKIIVHAPNREIAIARMKLALQETVVLGMGTNQSYLLAIADHPVVKQGKAYTHFLEKEMGDFLPKPSSSDLDLLIHARQEGFGKGSFSQSSTSNTDQKRISPWNHFGK